MIRKPVQQLLKRFHSGDPAQNLHCVKGIGHTITKGDIIICGSDFVYTKFVGHPNLLGNTCKLHRFSQFTEEEILTGRFRIPKKYICTLLALIKVVKIVNVV